MYNYYMTFLLLLCLSTYANYTKQLSITQTFPQRKVVQEPDNETVNICGLSQFP